MVAFGSCGLESRKQGSETSRSVQVGRRSREDRDIGLSSHVREFTQVQVGTCVIRGGNPRVLSFTISKVLLTQRVTDRYKKMQP